MLTIGETVMGGGNIWELRTFFCKPKTALRNEVYLLYKNQY